MKRAADDKLGIGEFSMMLLLSIAVKLSDTTPVLLFKRAKNGAWLLPIISALVLIPSLLLMLSLLKKYTDKDIIDICYKLMGIPLGFLYGLAMSVIMLIFMVISTRDINDTVITMFYPRTPPIVIYLLFMCAAVFIAQRGLRPLGSACFIIVPGLVFAVLTIILLSIPDMRTGYLFPITGIKFTEMLKGIPNYSSMVVEVLIFTILYPSVKSDEEYRKGTLFALALSVFMISAMCLTYLMVFDAVALQSIPFPFHMLTRMIRIGRFVTNAEAAYFALWIIAATLRFSIYVYITTRLFLSTFRRKDLKPYFKLIAAVVIFLGMLPDNFTFMVFKGRGYLLLSSFSVFIPLPFILTFLASRKGAVK
jgi:spore germination protein KB